MKKQGKKRIFLKILSAFLVALGFTGFFSAKWYIDVYGDVGVDSILFTLFGNNAGVEPGLVINYLLNGLLPAVLVSAVVCFLLLYRGKPYIEFTRKKSGKKIRIFPFGNTFMVVVSVILCLALLSHGLFTIDFPQWIKYKGNQTTLYDDEYIDPEKTTISFPKNKRNLIYIFMESMETTFLSNELGGAMKENLIPELYTLAEENTNFSNSKGVGGWEKTTSTSWTIASLVAQTSGITITSDGNEKNPKYGYIPGAATISDVLSDNGYYQAFMVGSDANFGNRSLYYTQHKTDKIYDLFTARESGIVPKDYYAWWGMEDKYLYKYAKQELTEIAKKNQPFAFSMLTVDTHHVGGYICSECENKHGEQYSNVLSCASRQVNEFVEWIKKQDFYENTTIVIVGDHLTMDNEYIKKTVPDDYTRRVYNCIINPAISTDNTKDRDFTPMDMFPTTLAAMGCKISGERLGLGTNMFSGVPTLVEKLGRDYVCEELRKNSAYYNVNFLNPERKK